MGKCTLCNGTGIVHEEVPYYSGALGPEITCPKCGGSGSDNPCTLCRGTGVVHMEVPYYSGALGPEIICPKCGGQGTNNP